MDRPRTLFLVTMGIFLFACASRSLAPASDPTSTPKVSIEEFLNYYGALSQTEGWTVSHVGHVSLHQADCEFSRQCVIINKGNTQVVLYYNGAPIRAEFDWPHLYSPN